MLLLRYAVLPQVESYRDEIVAALEKASGLAVSVRGLQGGWDGLRPHLTLSGLAIADRRGESALAFERAEATLSWWALAVGEVQFHDIEFVNPELVLRRGTDGIVYLADKPLNRAGPGEGDLAAWILRQPRLRVSGATLVWRDELAGAPELRLANVDITVRKRLGRHQALLAAEPPRHLAHRIELRAEVEIGRHDGRWQAAGRLYGEAMHADLARLRAHFALPETLRSGVGSLRAWATFSPQAVEEVTADVNMRDARARFAESESALALASVSGRAIYRARPGGFYVGTEGLRLRTEAGVEARPGSFSVELSAAKEGARRGEVRAESIDLAVAAALLEHLPVPRELKAEVVRHAPRGRVLRAAYTWSGESPARATAYAIQARFENAGVSAAGSWPGAGGITGSVEGTQAGGTLRLQSREASLDFPGVFRAPLAFASIEAKARWRHEGRSLVVEVEEARFANADAEGHFSGSWRSLPDSPDRSPGFVDIKGSLSRADVTRVGQYLPNHLSATRDWLDRSIEAGESPRASFEIRGDLWKFPWEGGAEGRFLVEGEVRDARLRYHRDWPSVDAIQGSVRFEGRRMEIRGERAAIFASRVSAASATIPDLGASPAVLTVAGHVDTAGGDAVRFLRESPLAAGPGAFTRAVSVHGPARLDLRIVYPLSGTDSVRVNGDYQFAGATAQVGDELAMSALKGRLSFSEREVRAPEITGTIFGEPATLRLATQGDGAVQATVEGRIGMPVLGAYLPDAFAARIAGSTRWRARVTVGREATQLAIDSDLEGLAVGLPEPFSKRSDECRPLAIGFTDLGAPGERVRATLGGNVTGRFEKRGAPGAERWRAALAFGVPPPEGELADGLWLHGELASVDLDAWQAIFAAPAPAPQPQAKEAIALAGFDLKLASFRYTGRELSGVSARMRREAGTWSGRVESPSIAGDIAWDPAGRGSLKARLERFSLHPRARTLGPERPGPEQDLPALDVVAGRFEFDGHWLGSLHLEARPEGAEWRIERLDIANDHAKFTSKGGSRRTATGPLTTLELKLQSSNLSALLGQFGYGDAVKRGQASLEGSLAWPGFAYDFGLSNLSGSFTVAASKGQFARMDPGAGKLLGLLSLQALPSRVTLDFRDVFSEGFAFERISGTVRVARGVLLTSDFEIAGPAALVTLAGEVSMPLETQTITLRVLPEMGESVALAATVLGTPALGLSTLIVSKLLQNPLGKVVGYEYLVTGTWDNPSVTRISAPAPRAAAAEPAPARSATP